MSSTLAWAAAAVSLGTFVGHTFVGGPRVAKPLLEAADLPHLAKWMAYFCWHVTTLLVLGMSAGFAYVATHPERPELAAFLTVLSLAIWILSLGITIAGKVRLRHNPGAWLFGLIALLGAGSLLA